MNLSRKIIILSAVISIAVLSSCSDDDGLQISPEEETKFQQEQKLTNDSVNAAITLSNLSDTVRNADGTITYLPKYGEPIEESSPYDYYVGVESFEEAVEAFTNDLIPQGDETNITKKSNGTIVYNINGHGSLTFRPQNMVDQYAVVDVDFKKMPEVQHIYYIPTSLWPNNGVTTPFNLGSIWKKNSEPGKYYICVREKQYGYPGLMISLNGTQKEWTCTRYRGSNGALKNARENFIYRGLSTSREAICALGELVKNMGQEAAQTLFNKAHVAYKVTDLSKAPFLYNTNVGPYTFHWGPSDHHYRIYIDQVYLKLDGNATVEHIEYNTCDKNYQRDQSKQSFYYSKSFEFDYISPESRDKNYSRVD